MSRFTLLRQDIRQLRRDPMLLMCMLGTLMIIAAVRMLPEVLESQQYRLGSFTLEEYVLLLFNLPLFLIPLLIGMVCGFMMLDDRDERIVMLYAVTPIGKFGYLTTKLAFPFAATFVVSLLACIVIPSGTLSSITLLFICLLSAMQAVLYALFLVAVVSNKVEGLALAKGLGICIAAPLAVRFVGFPFDVMLVWMPSYWVSKLIFAESVWHQWMGAVIGGLYHASLGLWLYRKYVRKLEL